MTSSGNLTAEDYKFAQLTCILYDNSLQFTVYSIHYLEKCKTIIFNNVIDMCLRMFIGCYSIKWITSVTMQLSGRSLLIESVRSDLPLLGHNYTESVTLLFDRLAHDACWNSVHVSTSRCRNRPHSGGTRSCLMPKM